MKILYCSDQDIKTHELLLDPIQKWENPPMCEGFPHVENLLEFLRKPQEESFIIVLFISLDCELIDIIQNKDLLSDRKLFFVFSPL